MTNEPEHRDKGWTEGRHATYQELLSRGGDPGRLADLWMRYGSSVFDRDVPYLLVALRRLSIDEYRRAKREDELVNKQRQAADRAPFTEADPAEIVASRNDLTEVSRALASLEERDAWALWWHAAGLNDLEIAQRWTEAGFSPANPSRDLLRKRRERARSALRSELHSDKN